MRQGLESTRDSATSNSNFVPLCVDSPQSYGYDVDLDAEQLITDKVY